MDVLRLVFAHLLFYIREHQQDEDEDDEEEEEGYIDGRRQWQWPNKYKANTHTHMRRHADRHI